MEWVLALGVLGAIFVFAVQRSSAKAQEEERRRIEENEEPVVIEVYSSMRSAAGPNVVEIVNDDGVPEFKYRFRANLGFDSPAQALRQHGQEAFIPRPNGNRDAIAELGGYWLAMSEWEDAEMRERFEEEPFKYIGGSKVYIQFLLSVREIYENKSLSPIEKRNAIERLCQDNYSIYTVKHVFTPPWESLLISVLSLAEGFGPHRVSLIRAAGIRTIADIRDRTDEELLEIKGVGKAAVAAMRNLSSQWAYDVNTEIIEKDAEFRRAVSLGHSDIRSHTSGVGL